jgi:iron complex transport system ATP-binding protein
VSELLSFQDVSFGYSRKTPPAIARLDLALKPGSITAILGPNGAGKTTLLYLALGWLKPWGGEVKLSGKPLQNYSRRILGQQIALIPQSEHIPFEYTVLEYVLLGRAPHLPPLGLPSPQDESIAFEALEKAGIAHLFNHSMLAISGGERQLALAARALAQEPRLLLLDEPTSHLDLSNKSRLVHIFKDLQKQGITILMTTHEPDIALAISDQAALMEKGRVLVSGSTDEVATAENLTTIYRVPVKIVTLEGKKQALWM